MRIPTPDQEAQTTSGMLGSSRDTALRTQPMNAKPFFRTKSIGALLSDDAVSKALESETPYDRHL